MGLPNHHNVWDCKVKGDAIEDIRTTISMRNSISQSGQNKKNPNGTPKVREHIVHMQLSS